MYREQWQGGILILTGVTLLLVICAVVVPALVPDSDITKASQIIQAFVASFILLSAGAFAAVRFELFRSFIPHLTLGQEITHRPISDSYVHLLVTTTVRNGSKVKEDLLRGYCRLQLLGPYSDSDVESIYREVFSDGHPDRQRDFQWETLDEKALMWNRNELTIEPGGSHQETCEFVVAAGVTSVFAYSYFYNSRKPFNPEGWGVATAHDIIGLDDNERSVSR